MFAYRVGFPGWKLLAQLGCPVKAKVTVTWDDEAQLFVGECTDFEPYLGIVTEAPTINLLKHKLLDCCHEALIEAFQPKNSRIADSVRFALQPLSNCRLQLPS